MFVLTKNCRLKLLPVVALCFCFFFSARPSEAQYDPVSRPVTDYNVVDFYFDYIKDYRKYRARFVKWQTKLAKAEVKAKRKAAKKRAKQLRREQKQKKRLAKRREKQLRQAEKMRRRNGEKSGTASPGSKDGPTEVVEGDSDSIFSKDNRELKKSDKKSRRKSRSFWSRLFEALIGR